MILLARKAVDLNVKVSSVTIGSGSCARLVLQSKAAGVTVPVAAALAAVSFTEVASKLGVDH